MKVPEFLKFEYMTTTQKAIAFGGFLMLMTALFYIGYLYGTWNCLKAQEVLNGVQAVAGGCGALPDFANIPIG